MIASIALAGVIVVFLVFIFNGYLVPKYVVEEITAKQVMDIARDVDARALEPKTDFDKSARYGNTDQFISWMDEELAK